MKSLGKLLFPLALGLLSLSVSPGMAVEPASRWHTGADFHRALATGFPVIDLPSGSSLRELLERFSQLQRVAIFLDRRIDPSTPVQLSERNITLAQVLARLADQCGGVVSYVGPVVYIGPRAAGTASLARVAQQRVLEARQLPRVRAARFLAEETWRWDELTEPRTLLDQLAQEAGVGIVPLELIPHDLWPGVDLPTLSWIERMTLVLAGFGLTFEWSDEGRQIQLVPLPTESIVARSYDVTLTQARWDQVSSQFSPSQLERTSLGIRFRGTQEEHQRLQELLQQGVSSPASPPRGGKTVHSLRVNEQPVGAILNTLAQQLSLRLEYAEGVNERLQSRVTFELREVPLEKLLEATLSPAGLTYRREQDVIRISPQATGTPDQSADR